MENNEEKKPSEKAISVGDVAGDVVISQNQIGGITAHTVVHNYTQPEPRHLTAQDEQNLNGLDRYPELTVLISMNNQEANSFGAEIINYLKSRGHSVVVNGYGILIPSPHSNPRYDIKPDGTSICISVPVQQ